MRAVAEVPLEAKGPRDASKDWFDTQPAPPNNTEKLFVALLAVSGVDGEGAEPDSLKGWARDVLRWRRHFLEQGVDGIPVYYEGFGCQMRAQLPD